MLASGRHHNVPTHRAEIKSPVVLFLERTLEGGWRHLISMGRDDVAGIVAHGWVNAPVQRLAAFDVHHIHGVLDKVSRCLVEADTLLL